jgi:DNA-binding MarR family transcriptional regulator
MGARRSSVPDALGDSLAQDPAVLTRIDRSLMALRQVLVRPVTSELPIPSLGRSVEFAKVVACEAVAAISSGAHAPTVKVLADALHVDHSTMSRVLADAEADGLLVRGQDPEDRRRTTVELSPDGRTLVADGQDLRVWFMAQVLDEWDPADVDALAGYLERAVATFQERFPLALAEAESRLGPLLPSSDD